MLSHDDEVRAVTEVAQRLMEAFPGVPADLVQETVRTSHERFAGSPIRDFVPVLVERMTKTALADPAADRTPLAGSGTKDRVRRRPPRQLPGRAEPVMIPDGLSLPQERLSNMDDTAGPDLADPRLQVVSAVLYLAGLALLVIGSVGAFLWSPVLWCAIVGLVLIAGAFVVAGGRFCPGAYGPAYRPARAAGLDADAPGATARPTGSTQTWQKPAIVGECPTHGEAR